MMSYLKFSFFALLLVNVNFVFGQFTAVSNINAHIDSLASHGISWVDYNNDGYEDIFIATGYPDMGSALANNVLLINNGDGTFAKHTTGDLVNTQGISRNTTWADFDNDGLTDVFVANQHTTELYKNEGGGVFAKALKLPTTGVLTDSDHSGAAWGDYDNDGNVDLFLASYMLNDQAKNILYKNNGDGTFTQVLAGESISNPGNSSDPTWIDIDQNGTLDLVVPNYCSANYIFANQGDGSFQPMTDNLLTSDNCSVGTSWADYDNDGDYDVLFQNNVNQSSQLFENEGDGTFTPVVDFVSNVSSSSATWGDFNNDGWIDLIQVGAGNNSEGHTVLLQNNGDKTFSDVTVAQGITNNNYSWGVASADYDRDGFLDFYVANSYGNDQSPHDILYHNTPNANGWVNIKLTGTSANRSAIGANVRLKADGLWQMRTVQSKTGSNSQNSLHVHFGLGTASIIDTIIVQWPNGGQQQLFSQSINQFLDIQEPVFPAIPDNLVTTNNAVGEVILTWNDNASNETGYRIERSEGNQNNFSVISIVAADITTFTDTGLKEGVIYHYRIASTINDGYSAPSVLSTAYSRQQQTISLDPFGFKALDSPPIQLNATVSSGLPPAYAILEGQEFVSLTGNKLSILALGTSRIGAFQVGNVEYLPSDTAVQVLEVKLVSGTTNELNTISIYPNPVKNLLNIQCPCFKGYKQVTLSLYHINGVMLKSTTTDRRFGSELSINMANYQQGMYIVNIVFDESNLIYKVFKE